MNEHSKDKMALDRERIAHLLADWDTNGDPDDWRLEMYAEAAEVLQEAGLRFSEDSVDESPVEQVEVPLEFVLTCRALPEQYDVLRDGRQIGYLRLRHGYFRAHYPDHRGRSVYETGVRGYGDFHDQEEREREIRKAAVELLRADGVMNPAPVFELAPFVEEEDSFDVGILMKLLEERNAQRKSELADFLATMDPLIEEAKAQSYSAEKLRKKLEEGGYLATSIPSSWIGDDSSIGAKEKP